MKVFRIVSVLIVLTFLTSTVAFAQTPAPSAPITSTAPAAAPIVLADNLKQPVKIGIIAPMTGDVSTFGASTRDGATLAFEEWNALGAKLEWVIGDDRCDPQEARNAANKAIDQDKVKFIVGAVCSSSSIPISEVANQKGVLQVSPTSTNPSVTVDKDGKVKPYTFRACFIDPFQGTVAATFALKTLKAKTAAVVRDNGNDYVKGLAEYFEAAFKAGGGQVVVSEAYTKDDTDFSAILSKVADAKPDFFYIPDYYQKVNLIAKQAQDKGIQVTMMGGDGWDSPDLDLSAVDGGYFTNHYSADDPRPEVQQWVAKYLAKYKAKPDALATLAYDAANIMLTAMNEANSTDPAVVKDTLAKIKFNGVSGQITYDALHNPVKAAAILAIKDGKVTYKDTVAPNP
jgi:branched-chain amino acid transport system substrate-binding protein